MSLPNRLKSARMTDATAATAIDDHVGLLEQAICDILGITIDTDHGETVNSVAHAIFESLDVYNRIGKLRIGGAAQAGVLRMIDTTTSTEFALRLNNRSLEFCERTGGNEGAPTYTVRAALDLSDGTLGLAWLELEDTPSSFSSKKYRVPSVNSGETALELTNEPSAGMSGSAALAVADLTTVNLDFSSEQFDYGSFVNLAGNDEIFTAPVAGRYLVTATCMWATAASGSCQLSVHVNAGALPRAAQVNSFPNATNMPGTWQSVATILELSASDTVSFVAFQDSGGSVNITTRNARIALIR